MIVDEFFKRFYAAEINNESNLFTADQMLLFAESYKHSECYALTLYIEQLKRLLNGRHILITKTNPEINYRPRKKKTKFRKLNNKLNNNVLYNA